MKPYSRVGIALFITLLVAACYSPVLFESASMSTEEAKKVLAQTFEEQPEKFRPVAVEIGDDTIRLGFSAMKLSKWTGAPTTVSVNESYYYMSLQAPEILKGKGRWQVRLSNREQTVHRWVYFYSEETAVRFVSALRRMTGNQ